LATKADDNSGQYILILCNAIGSPMDSKYIDVQPRYLCMTEYHVIVAGSCSQSAGAGTASEEVVYVWQYRTGGPKIISADSAALAQLRRKDGREKMWHVDDLPSASLAGGLERIQSHEATTDFVCSVCGSDKLLLVGRESGQIQVYSLPHVTLEGKIQVNCRPQMISLNCKSSKFACIDIHGAMSLWTLDFVPDNQNSTKSNTAERMDFDRKDAWDVLWSDDEPDMFAVLEKARMYIFRNLSPEEPVTSSAYLCKFSELQITAVQLDEIIKDPEHPSREYVVEHETRSLRDARLSLSPSPSLSQSESASTRTNLELSLSVSAWVSVSTWLPCLNGPNVNKGALKEFEKKYPWVSCLICACHCLSGFFKAAFKLPSVVTVFKLASGTGNKFRRCKWLRELEQLKHHVEHNPGIRAMEQPRPASRRTSDMWPLGSLAS